MNCMSSKVRRRKEQVAYEREKAEEKEYLDSLSEEERITYLKKKEEHSKQAMRLLTTAMAFLASVGALGPYSTKGTYK